MMFRALLFSGEYYAKILKRIFKKKSVMMQPYNKYLKLPSRDLRNNMTDAEHWLWQRLRRKQILGLQFYRQKPILNFIVDFYCSSANLVIECDGGQHYTEDGRLADQIRDQALSELGLVVLRFSNRQILTETDAVVEQVYWIAKQRLESP